MESDKCLSRRRDIQFSPLLSTSWEKWVEFNFWWHGRDLPQIETHLSPYIAAGIGMTVWSIDENRSAFNIRFRRRLEIQAFATLEHRLLSF